VLQPNHHPKIAQATTFMQNKLNFQKSQIRLTISTAKTYAKMDTWSQEKNKPNLAAKSAPAESSAQRPQYNISPRPQKLYRIAA